MDDSQVMRSMVRDDAYRVVNVLAEGPSGKTELVTLGGSELLVRKRIPAGLANATAWATAMGIHEPRLPHIEEIYQMPDELVVVYSYVAGQSLRELVATHGALPPQRAAGLAREVCQAAAALHAAGLVHRDITPGNVIVADDGAHLVDLGIARRQRAESSHDTSVLGTWGFAAPEQFGFAQTDCRSDVYALGRLLGFMLTGINPGTDEYERAMADPAVVAPALAEVCSRASSFEPSARYQSADEFAAAVAIALDASTAVRATSAQKFARSGESAADVLSVSYAQEPVASDARGPRPFAQTFLLVRIVAILLWTMLGFFVLVVVAVCNDALMGKNDRWFAAQYGMSVVTCGAAGVLAREVYLWATCRGRYEHEDSPHVALAIRVCKILGITLLMMILCAAVLPAN